ncbi:MAG: ABC transporter permease [Acidimicrobiia bacterium]|nr:ABC transporter permease [Acidimicrobiia bacterium]
MQATVERPIGTGTSWTERLRTPLAFLAVLLFFILLWEGYKVFGKATFGADRPFFWVPRPDNTSMPHVWDIVDSLFSPVSRARGADPLILILLRNAATTAYRAGLGFLIGSAAGFTLGAVFSRSRLLERGLMPFVVASQTIPLIAIAPMIVIWGGRIGWPPLFSVAIISAYLAFFPVTINSLRGLRSPDPRAIELMRSYAASKRQILWKVRLPASLPYLFTALKIAATTSVIGAIVGELPAGVPDGLGRALLTFNQYFITGPERMYAAILVSALVGIGFYAIVALAETLVERRSHQQRPADIGELTEGAVEELERL